MIYRLLIKSSASREAERIPKKIKEKIRRVIRSLADTPRPHGVKKLKGKVDIFRVRVGEYRILYTVDDREKEVRIISVLDRKEAYR